MLGQLAVDNLRCLGFEHHHGMFVGISPSASPAQCSPRDPGFGGYSFTNRFGGEQIATERGYCGSAARLQSTPVHKSCLLGPQKGRFSEAGGELEAFQQVYSQHSFQDGKHPDAKGPSQERRLDGVYRPERCVFVDTDHRDPSKISQVCLEGQHLSVSGPSLWSEQCPSYFYKGIEVSGSLFAAEGLEINNLHRRYIIDASIRLNPGSSITRLSVPVPAIGLCGEPGKICPHSLPADMLLGFCDRFKGDGVLPSPGQGSEHHSGLQKGSFSGIVVRSGSGTALGSDVSFNAGGRPGPPSLQSSATSKERGVPSVPVFQFDGHSGQGSQNGSHLVDLPAESLEWQECAPTVPRHDYSDGCFSVGMGSCHREYIYRRCMVSRREAEAHKCAGVGSSSLCYSGLCWKQHKSPHSSHDGQHVSHLIYQSDGRNKVPKLAEICQRFVALVFRKRHLSLRSPPPRSGQCDCRQGVEVNAILSRVDVTPGHLLPATQDSGSLPSGPVCDSSEQSASPVCELAPGSVCDSSGCFFNSLAGDTGICLSPICSDREVSSEAQAGGGLSFTHSPSLASSSVVSSTTRISGGSTSPLANEAGLVEGSVQPESSLGSSGNPPIGRLEGIRRRFEAGGVSQDATDLITAGWSKGTNVAYQSAWRKWSSWCSCRSIDPFSCDVRYFVNFLAELFSSGLQHRSINTIRSAVSMTHDQIGGTPIGQHPLVTRLMKGVYNSRPPRPRYETTWDVDVVIDHLISMGDNKDLSLKSLSQKLAVLLALVEASRSSELAALDLSFRRYFPEGVRFRLDSLTKKRTPGTPPRELFFGAFPPNPLLCVVKCLRIYEERTSELRPEGCTRLFISYVKPHKPVSSQRIAHWIKDLLKEAGIDTNVFSAHSTRGASTTAAKEKGATLTDILSTADWSSDSTFRRFYYRPSETSSSAYAVTVLSGDRRERHVR